MTTSGRITSVTYWWTSLKGLIKMGWLNWGEEWGQVGREGRLIRKGGNGGGHLEGEWKKEAWEQGMWLQGRDGDTNCDSLFFFFFFFLRSGPFSVSKEPGNCSFTHSITSGLDNCNSLYSCLSKHNLSMHFSGKRSTYCITQILASLCWLSAQARIDFKIWIITLKAWMGQPPPPPR